MSLGLSSTEITRQHIMGIDIDAVTLQQATERCQVAIAEGQTLVVGCVNAAKVVRLREDESLRDAVAACDLIIADGMPLVWAGRLLGRRLPERVTGIDLFLELLKTANDRSQRVYLLGARQQIVELVVAHIREKYPRIDVVGYRNGYFDDREEDDVAAQIKESGAQMLFLGITSPKKELFLRRYGPRLGVGVAHGVGGSFDVLAGAVRRAPAWMQRFGLEWLFRVFQEPRRMWKRYLVTNTQFLWMLLAELAGRQKR